MRKPKLLSELKKKQKQELKKLTRPNKKTFERFEREQKQLKEKQKKYRVYQKDKRETERTIKKEYARTKKAVKGKSREKIAELWKAYNYTKKGLQEDLKVKRLFTPYILNNSQELTSGKTMLTYELKPDYAQSLKRFYEVEIKPLKIDIGYTLIIAETELHSYISESFAFWEFKKYITSDPEYLINIIGEKMEAFKSDDSQEIIKYFVRVYLT